MIAAYLTHPPIEQKIQHSDINPTLAREIQTCSSLPSVPAVAVEVMQIIENDREVHLSELARVISKDPALSLRVLGLVNSGFCRRRRRVHNLVEALVILGLRQVRVVVLGFSLADHLLRSRRRHFDVLSYWQRSNCAAAAAQILARRLGGPEHECFVAALLMDVGMLALDQVLGSPYGQLVATTACHADLAPAEWEALGLTHAHAAELLATRWNLPPALSRCMGFHHRPTEVREPRLRNMAEIVHASGLCADLILEQPQGGSTATLRDHFHRRFRIDGMEIDTILADITEHAEAIAPWFDGQVNASVPASSVLSRARQALVDLTLDAERRNARLAQHNSKLRSLATTDPLTGLANRLHFEQVLAKEAAAAMLRGGTLAVLLLDIDEFKQVNDRWGHAAGDEVLRVVGRLLKTACGLKATAVRYGGEEFAVVLPGSTHSTALRQAEKLRRAIQDARIPINGQMLSVSASIGVATGHGRDKSCQARQLVLTADLALYAAKHAGRNCVRLFTNSPTSSAGRAAPLPPGGHPRKDKAVCG